MEDAYLISSTLASACESINNLLEDAKEKAKNLSVFLETELGPSLGPAIGVYANLFKGLGVTSRQDLETKIRSQFKHAFGKVFTV